MNVYLILISTIALAASSVYAQATGECVACPETLTSSSDTTYYLVPQNVSSPNECEYTNALPAIPRTYDFYCYWTGGNPNVLFFETPDAPAQCPTFMNATREC